MQSVSPSPCSRMVDLGEVGVAQHHHHPLLTQDLGEVDVAQHHHHPLLAQDVYITQQLDNDHDDDPLDFIPPCQFDTAGDDGFVRMALGEPMCSGCGFGIRERFLLKVVDDFWHENCLRCCSCERQLADRHSCFVKNGRVFCRDDHRELFFSKCARCQRELRPSDVVYRCSHATFHVNCFTCIYCQQALKKGDEYLLVDGHVICRRDYENIAANQALTVSGFYDREGSESSRKTPKRPRTILNATQRRAFKASFEKSSKPCRKVREALAKETGLSVRVVQVWFQNQRAKIKKMQRKSDGQKGGGSLTGDSEPKSMDDAKSPTESDEVIDSDLEDFDKDDVSSRGAETTMIIAADLDRTNSSNPIDRLYSMQAAYFAF